MQSSWLLGLPALVNFIRSSSMACYRLGVNFLLTVAFSIMTKLEHKLNAICAPEKGQKPTM